MINMPRDDWSPKRTRQRRGTAKNPRKSFRALETVDSRGDMAERPTSLTPSSNDGSTENSVPLGNAAGAVADPGRSSRRVQRHGSFHFMKHPRRPHATAAVLRKLRTRAQLWTYKYPHAIAMSKKEVVALLVVFILFVVIGGAVFMAVEGPQEIETRAKLVQLRKKFFDKLEELHHPNFTKREMVDMIRQLANARSRNLLDMSGRETNVNWNFYNSFFFAITVVTTIGYGHVSPSTVSGRLFCVAYAMIGVPLTGILLAAIGDHFSKHLVKRINAARKVYTSKIALAVNAATFLVPWLVVFLILPAGLFMYIEGWTYLEALYYCFISLATIGFGDYVAGNFEGDYIWIYKAAVVLWIIFGLGYLAMILNYISRAMRSKKVRRMEHRLSSSFQNTQQKLGARLDEMQKILQEFAVKQRKTRPSPKKCRSFGNMVEEAERDGSYRLAGARPGSRVTIVEHPSSEGSESGEIERLLTLVEVLKEESTQNLYRTKQLLEDTERDLLSFCREDSADSSQGVALAVPGTPNRRHSLPVLLTPSPPTSGDSLSGEVPGPGMTRNLPSPRTEFAASPGNASLLGRSFQSFLYRKRPDILDLEAGNRRSKECVKGDSCESPIGMGLGIRGIGESRGVGDVDDDEEDDNELDNVQSSRM